MKIALITESITYSGASKMLVNLANYLVGKDHVVYIITVDGKVSSQKINDKINMQKIMDKESNNWLVRNTFGTISKIYSLQKLSKKFDLDCMLSFGDALVVPLILSKFTNKAKIIVSERVDPYNCEGLMDKVKRYLYKWSDGMIFQTNGAKEYYREKFNKQGIVIPNPVIKKDIPDRYEGIRENRIVSVGRLEIKQKRQDILIKALPSIIKEYPEIILDIYGDGNDKEALLELVSNLEITKNVKFHGVSNNVYNSILKSKVFVLSSDYEGIPNALIEAMSIGLPVVSTDCSPGGARLLIKNFTNGLLVTKGNIDELSKAVLYMLDNYDEANRMGLKAKSVLQDYEEDRIFGLWCKYLSQF